MATGKTSKDQPGTAGSDGTSGLTQIDRETILNTPWQPMRRFSHLLFLHPRAAQRI
jgi:hypothetical protein